MKLIQKTIGLSAIALLVSMVGIVTAQPRENPELITLEGPSLNEPLILPSQTTLPIQEGILIDRHEPGSIVGQSDNPFEVGPGQIDELEQRIPSQSAPAATIPPALNAPQSVRENAPYTPAPNLTAPQIQNYGAPRCPLGAASCLYEREQALRSAYVGPPTGYVPYGGLGLDRPNDYHRASRYDYDRRARYEYYQWLYRTPILLYQVRPYGVCPNEFGY